MPTYARLPEPPGSVVNQPPPLEPYDVFESDRVLVEGLEREGGAWARDRAGVLGRLAGGEAVSWGFDANRHPPLLRTHDRFGGRIDEVEFHPAWHALMRTAVEHALHALPWREPRPGAHVARSAMYFAFTQAEAGHGCPITMTFAVVPALRAQPELAVEWEPLLTSLVYDPRLAVSSRKRGAIAGMAMTEKQGGSDVRSNTTLARPAGPQRGPGAEYLLTGDKWFCSAPMSDVFLTLAQTPKGLSCFLLPRVLPDGSRNRFHLQRLKDKLGNRSNASGEVEFRDAWARLVGEEGRGVPTIIEMVTHTRLDCVMGSAALMRQAVAQATHHAAYRSAFGRQLSDQPLMRNVLADLCLESEAATTLMLRLARAYDEARHDAVQRRFARIATAIAKFWVCKRAVAHVGEALECLGGNGYVEESVLPRLYREAPVNSVWEGSGNVICLDVLRALAKDPECADTLFAELALASGASRRLDAFVAQLKDDVRDSGDVEFRARSIVGRLAVALQAALLARHAPHSVSDAFAASRLGEGGQVFGTLPPGIDAVAIIERARPSSLR